MPSSGRARRGPQAHVPAIHHDRLVLRCSQRDVQNGPFLREIDLLTVKHGVDPLAQAALIREFEQQADRLIGDAVLRVVEVETYSLKREVLGALGILRESWRRCAFCTLA